MSTSSFFSATFQTVDILSSFMFLVVIVNQMTRVSLTCPHGSPEPSPSLEIQVSVPNLLIVKTFFSPVHHNHGISFFFPYMLFLDIPTVLMFLMVYHFHSSWYDFYQLILLFTKWPILNLPNLKAFTDDNFRVAQMVQFFFDSLRNCGKRRNCWFWAFSPFPMMFLKGFFATIFKSHDCGVKA